jgi:hypothetical protein
MSPGRTSPAASPATGATDHVVLGVRNHARQELAGVQLDGQLYTVFSVRDGQIVHLHDHAHRADALTEAGLGDYRWR